MISQRILVPLDLSGHYDTVLNALENFGAGKPITLLHVIETIQGLPEEELADFYVSLEEKAQDTLRGVAERLRAAGNPCELVIERGRRGATIVRFAAESAMTLIVLRSRQMRPQQGELGLGSTSHQVALAAPCSVLLLRE